MSSIAAKGVRGADFGLDARVSYSPLTYRAVDLAVSVGLTGAMALLPALLSVTRWWMRLSDRTGGGEVRLGTR